MKNILLIEKRGEVRAILAASLRARGFHVVQAKDEGAAMAAFAFRPTIDLAIMTLPDGHWPAALIAARKNGNYPPIILLTNRGDDKSLQRSPLPGVTSLSLRQRRYTSERHLLLRELDRQIRLALRRQPSLDA